MSLRQYAQQTQEGQQAQQAQNAPAPASRDQNMIDLSNDNDRLKRQQEALNKHSGTVKTDILKGLEAGKDLTDLFCIACKGIANITGENLFYDTVCNKLKERGMDPGMIEPKGTKTK